MSAVRNVWDTIDTISRSYSLAEYKEFMEELVEELQSRIEVVKEELRNAS